MASCGCGGARERVEVMARPVYKVPLGLLYLVCLALVLVRGFWKMAEPYTTAAAYGTAVAMMAVCLVAADRCGSCGAAEASAKLPSGAKGWRVRG